MSAESAPNTTLRGPWLFIARAAWVVIVVLTLTLVVVSLRYSVNDILYNWRPLTRGALLLGIPSRSYAEYLVILKYTAALAFFVTAAVIFWRKSNDWMAIIVSLTLVTFPAGLYLPDIGSFARAWEWLETFVDFFGIICFGILFLLFPDGRFVPRWAWLLAVVWPIAILGMWRWTPGWLLVSMVLILVFAQIYRYVRVSDPVRRQQTKWVVFGLAIQIAWLLWSSLNWSSLNESSVWRSPLSAFVAVHGDVLVPLLLPLTIAFSILRYRLWDIDLIINRTLVYGALVGIVVGLYVLVVGSLGALFLAGGNLLLSILATGLIAILFQPLRQRLQRGVNRLMYGERDDPATVLSRLGQRLEAAIAPDTVLSTIVETVAQALKLPYAAIEVSSGQSSVIGAEWKAAGQSLNPDHRSLITFPLVYQGEIVGQLILAPRAPGESFSLADRRLLEDIAHHAGAAVHAVRLTADLQHSRERLVIAREEERRRLRRDLHDGLGPTLAGATLRLDAALDLLGGDPETGAAPDPAAARALLLELKAQTQVTVAEIRRLVYELRPPALDELGLVSALREHAMRYTGSSDGLHISVEAPSQGLPPLSAAVDVAAYRIALEAVTNVVRHARADSCLVRFSVDDALHVEIVDNGIGIQPNTPAGVGLTSMRERAAELGGTCLIERVPNGGTRVLARLPLSRET